MEKNVYFYADTQNKWQIPTVQRFCLPLWWRRELHKQCQHALHALLLPLGLLSKGCKVIRHCKGLLAQYLGKKVIHSPELQVSFLLLSLYFTYNCGLKIVVIFFSFNSFYFCRAELKNKNAEANLVNRSNKGSSCGTDTAFTCRDMGGWEVQCLVTGWVGPVTVSAKTKPSVVCSIIRDTKCTDK